MLCRDGDTPESAVLCRDGDTPESAVLCRDGDKISRVSLPDLGFFLVWGRRSEYGGPSVIYGEILFQALQHFYFSADTENQ